MTHSRRCRRLFCSIAFVLSLALSPIFASAAPLTSHAGLDQSANIGQTVTLDGSASTLRSADTQLAYEWSLVAPAGSGARLSDPYAPRPTFTVDLLGDYIATLIVTDDVHTSTSQVRVSTGNVAPTAHIDRAVTLSRSAVVVLDGSASRDANGDALRYKWSLLSAPDGSNAQIEATDTATPTLVTDVYGDYMIELRVNDGTLTSAPDTMLLSTQGSAGIADAGRPKVIAAGQSVTLHAGASFDPDGNALRYEWRVLYAPAKDQHWLSETDSPTPSFTAFAPGDYVLQLAVDDGSELAASLTTTVVSVVERGAMTQNTLSRGGLDTDGDGVPDDIDNCVNDFNPTQLDTNGDGFGNRCDPDLDNDGFITNFGDLGLLRLAFFSTPGAPNWNPDADFNGDNSVNFIDLGIMRTFFFGPPGPLALTFINPNGGSWHDPANWSPPIIPNTTHTVRIDLEQSAVVEYSTGSSEIAGLVATSPVAITGGLLSIAGNAQFDADLTINGATLATANVLPPSDPDSAQITATGNVTLDDVDLGMDLNIENAATVTVIDGLTLDGATISINSSGSFSVLNFTGGNGAMSVLDGTGQIVFNGTTTASTVNEVRATTSHNLTIGSDITVRSGNGGGRVRSVGGTSTLSFNGNVVSDTAGRSVILSGRPLVFNGNANGSNGGTLEFDFVSGDSRITSSALIDAVNGDINFFGTFEHEGLTTLENGTLDIGSNTSTAWSNTGSIDIINGSIELGGTFTAADAGVISGSGDMLINGILQNTGNDLDVATLFPGAIALGGNGSLLGGSLITTPVPVVSGFTMDGVTLGADVSIANAASLTVRNDLILDEADVTIASDGSFSVINFSGDADQTSLLGGSGRILFSGTTTSSSVNEIRIPNAGHNLTIGAGVSIETVTTGGRIRNVGSDRRVTLDGSIVSNVTGRSVEIAGAPLIINGTLDATNGGIIRASFQPEGSLISSSAVLSASDGELELFGPFTNAGTINVTDGTLDIGNNGTDSWSNAGTININNATVELGGFFTVADAGTFSGNGTLLLNGTLDNTGGVVDFGSLFSGALTLGGNGTVLGGSIVTSPFSVSSSFTFDGVTLAADMTVENAATLTIVNDLILNNASVLLSSAGSFTTMTFSGASGDTSLLGGTGQVRFAGTTSSSTVTEIRVSPAGHNLEIESGVTIVSDTTGGRVRNISTGSAITLNGGVESNVAGRAVTIQGAPLTIIGTLEATTGGKIIADFVTPGQIAAAATVSASGTDSEIELQGFVTNDAAISITDGTLDIGNNTAEGWANNGSITLNNGNIELGGMFATADIGTLSGTGTALIDGLLDNTGQALDTATILSGDVSFGGNGTLLGGSLVTTPAAVASSFTFDGVTLGTDLSINNAAALNVLNGLTLSNGNIELESLGSFTILSFNGPSGSTSTLGGTGEVRFAGTTTSSSVSEIRNSGAGHNLLIDTGVTVRSVSTGGRLRTIGGTATIEYNGTVISDIANRTITLQSANAVIFGGTATATNGGAFIADFGTGSQVTSAATLSANNGEIGLLGPFTQAGTISVTDGTLDIGNNNTEAWNNTGSITLTNGTIELGGLIVPADVGTIAGTGTMLIDGDINNSGQTFDAGTLFGGTITLGGNGALIGGTLATTPVAVVSAFEFDQGVDLAVDLTIANNGRLDVRGGLTLNNSDISIESDGSFSYVNFAGSSGEAVTFGGNGEVRFAGTTTSSTVSEIRATGSIDLTIDAGITIRTDTTGGRVRSASGSNDITIAGSVISDVAGRSVTLSSPALVVEGTIDTTVGATTALGTVTIDPGAVLNAQIGGLGQSLLGRYTTTNATLAGTFNVTLANGFAPTLGQSFTLLTYSSNSGTFDTLNVPGLGGGLSLTEAYNAGDLTFTVTN